MIIRETVDDAGNVIASEVVKEKSPWMKISEAADFLGVTEHTIHEYAKARKLTKYRVAGFSNIRVRREDVENLIQPVPVSE